MALAGTYKVVVESMGNQAEGMVRIEERGGKLTGVVEAMGMNAEVEDFKATGSSFSGSIEGPTPLGTMRFKVNGAVKGDTIEGVLRAGLVGAKFKGTRV